ncbi:hypothetical protein SLS60_002130 [Paraconiothyrium brasiliense]|uniref:BTB domain-containing protein n=1 Tax=Paraconiothyrium brasiliense TaxID=300254 RepID=A0ABR3S1G2_9PLEO
MTVSRASFTDYDATSAFVKMYVRSEKIHIALIPYRLTDRRLQGPAVRVIVGSDSPASTLPLYILPQALLCANSRFFKDELAKPNRLYQSSSLNSTDLELSKSDVDREISAESELTDTPNGASTVETSATATISVLKILTINLQDVDPTAFGLFLTFLYHGVYRPSYSDPLTLKPANNSTLLKHTPTYPITSPVYPSSSTSLETIPPPILACTLGTFLSATAFTNHSMAHTYNSTGVHFSLTPATVHYIWTHTCEGQGLRAFMLDVLCQYWSVPTSHISRSPQSAWEDLFTTHPDLRRVFIFGLQGRKVGALKTYLIAVRPLFDPRFFPTHGKQTPSPLQTTAQAFPAPMNGEPKPTPIQQSHKPFTIQPTIPGLAMRNTSITPRSLNQTHASTSTKCASSAGQQLASPKSTEAMHTLARMPFATTTAAKKEIGEEVKGRERKRVKLAPDTAKLEHAEGLVKGVKREEEGTEVIEVD